MKSLLRSASLLAIGSMVHSVPMALGLSIQKIQTNNHAINGMRRVVVTDGSLGREICESLLMNYQDVRVVLGGKDKNALDHILDKVGDEHWRNLEHVHLDIDCDASVDMAARELALHVDPLHAIIYTPPTDRVSVSSTKEKHSSMAPENSHYLGLKRTSKALMPLLQSTHGRWVTVVPKEESRFFENLARILNQKALFKASTEPGRMLLATANNHQMPWDVAVNQIDHISQVNTPTGSKQELSKALVHAYSVLLAHQQDRHGVVVQTVEQSSPGRIISACIESPDYVRLWHFPLPSLPIALWIKHLWSISMTR